MGRFDAETPSDLAVSYSSLFEGAYTGAIGYARPRVGPGALGLGVQYFSQGSLASYNSVGDNTGSFTPNDFALTGAYGLTVKRLRVGAGLKIVRSSLADASAMTVAVDAGVQADRVFDLGDGPVDLGAALTNLGFPQKLGSVASPLPFSARGGAAWHAGPNFNATLDLVMPIDQDPYVSMGAEVYMRQKDWSGFVRLGFNQAHTRSIDGLTGLTAGGGLDFRKFRIDYAWVPYGDLGMMNRITLAFRF